MENKSKAKKKINYDESQDDKFILELVDLNASFDVKKLDDRE